VEWEKIICDHFNLNGKEKKELHELRFYDKDGYPLIEIAYHPESAINNGDREHNIVHYHTFNGINRNDPPFRMDKHPEVKEKYKEYLQEFNLYDKC